MKTPQCRIVPQINIMKYFRSSFKNILTNFYSPKFAGLGVNLIYMSITFIKIKAMQSAIYFKIRNFSFFRYPFFRVIRDQLPIMR